MDRKFGLARDVVFALINLGWAGFFLAAFLGYGSITAADYNNASMLPMLEGLALLCGPLAVYLVFRLWDALAGTRQVRLAFGFAFALLASVGFGLFCAWHLALWEGADWMTMAFLAMIASKAVGSISRRALWGDRGSGFGDAVAIVLACGLPAFLMATALSVVQMAFIGTDPALYLLMIQFGFLYFVLLALYRVSEDPRFRELYPFLREAR